MQAGEEENRKQSLPTATPRVLYTNGMRPFGVVANLTRRYYPKKELPVPETLRILDATPALFLCQNTRVQKSLRIVVCFCVETADAMQHPNVWKCWWRRRCANDFRREVVCAMSWDCSVDASIVRRLSRSLDAVYQSPFSRFCPYPVLSITFHSPSCFPLVRFSHDFAAAISTIVYPIPTHPINPFYHIPIK